MADRASAREAQPSASRYSEPVGVGRGDQPGTGSEAGGGGARLARRDGRPTAASTRGSGRTAGRLAHG
eukprot:12175443-Alexandrium_andersonii.AAC.1